MFLKHKTELATMHQTVVDIQKQLGLDDKDYCEAALASARASPAIPIIIQSFEPPQHPTMILQ